MECSRSYEKIIADLRAAADPAVMSLTAELAALCRHATDLFDLARYVSHEADSYIMSAGRAIDVLRPLAVTDESRAALTSLSVILGRLGDHLGRLRRSANDEAKRMAGRLASSASTAPSVPEALDLVGLTKAITDMAQSWLGDVSVSFEPPAEPLYVRADWLKVELVIHELLTNGSRQLEDQPDGSLAVRVVATEGEVILEVEDNGPGIAPEIKPRIFDTSFYGPRGRTGHGLPMIRRVMKEAGGWIEPATRAGGLRGTRFRAGFPRVVADEVPHSTLGGAVRRYRSILDLGTGERFRCYRTLQLGGYNGCRALRKGRQWWLKPAPLRSEAARLLEREAMLLRRGHAIGSLIHLEDLSTGLRDQGEEVLFLWLAPAEGTALDEILGSEWLPPDDLLTVAHHGAFLLAELHRVGILCRTLPPAAFYYDGATSTVPLTLVDLSQAVRLSHSVSHRGVSRPDWDLRGAHGPTSDFRYVAPEHYAGFTPDVRSDIYAFGLLLYETIVTEPLFGLSPEPADVAQRRAGAAQAAERLHLVAQEREIPSSLVGVIARCLEYRPGDRYQSAQELLSAVTDCIGAQPGAGHS